jgi:hypothetical protein
MPACGSKYESARFTSLGWCHSCHPLRSFPTAQHAFQCGEANRTELTCA